MAREGSSHSLGRRGHGIHRPSWMGGEAPAACLSAILLDGGGAKPQANSEIRPLGGVDRGVPKSGVRMRSWSLAVLLVLGLCALAQEAPPVFHGRWTATVGPAQVLVGTWTGQASPGRPNVVQGSWTLLGETGQILLEGTWSAQRTRLGWQGTWSARALHGQAFSGTWRADIADLNGKTLEEMLEWTAEKQIAGSWRSGRYQGNWWLKGPPPQGR
jgi:hypothetical protein